jgi:4,5-DOPA dioxygenase extradiol
MAPLPTLFLSHGAPPLSDDATWVAQLRRWGQQLPRPAAVLIVSAHWESAPLAIGSTTDGTPLEYDFWGFPEKYYRAQYAAPGAPELAGLVESLMPDREVAVRQPRKGLDHGAYVPLAAMYPEADVPVLQISLPTLNPERLLALGARLRPLREQGVLIIGSGFTTHGLPFLTDMRAGAEPPTWSREFDMWAHESLAHADLEALVRFRKLAPGMPYAHPTAEHFAPLFVALGASSDPEQVPTQKIDGFWMGLAKRSVEFA